MCPRRRRRRNWRVVNVVFIRENPKTRQCNPIKMYLVSKINNNKTRLTPISISNRFSLTSIDDQDWRWTFSIKSLCVFVCIRNGFVRKENNNNKETFYNVYCYNIYRFEAIDCFQWKYFYFFTQMDPIFYFFVTMNLELSHTQTQSLFVSAAIVMEILCFCKSR